MDPNCKIEGGFTAGPALRRANYIDNFKITCSKSNISFDLQCSTNHINGMISKPIQGT